MKRHARTHSILPLAMLMENSLYFEGPSDEEKLTVSVVEQTLSSDYSRASKFIQAVVQSHMPARFWHARLAVVWENQFFLRSFCAVYTQPNYFEISVFPVSKVLPLALLMVVMTQLSLHAFLYCCYFFSCGCGSFTYTVGVYSCMSVLVCCHCCSNSLMLGCMQTAI